MQLFFRSVQCVCVCVYVYMRAMQLGLQGWHFAYFVLLNLCTGEGEWASLPTPYFDFFSFHSLSSFLPYSAAALVIFYSFFIFISANLCCWIVCANLLSEFSTSTVLCLRRVPFFWRWVNWGHKQKEAENSCAVSLMLVYGFADASQVTTAKYFSHVPQSMRAESQNNTNFESATEHYWRFTRADLENI